jgi:hypothetical protein
MPGFVTLTDPTGAVELVTLDTDDCRLLAFPAQQLADRARVNGAPAAEVARFSRMAAAIGRIATIRQATSESVTNRHDGFDPERSRPTLTVRDITERTGMTESTALRRCREVGTKIRGRWFVSEEDAEKMEHRNAS